MPGTGAARRLGVVLLVASAWLVAACGGPAGSTDCGAGATGAGPSPACSHGPTAGPGTIPQDVAVAAARAVVPATGDPVVVWAAVEPDPFVAPNAPNARQVWEVRLEGPLTVPACAADVIDRPATPRDPPCLDATGGLVVVVDAATGGVVGFTH